MFIELFFATTLNMSMPEFQPQKDISGNVIVSEVDISSGEFIAEEVPLNEIPIEKTSDLPLLGLSQEEDPTGNDSKVSLGEVILSNEINTITASSISKKTISTYHMQIRGSSNVDDLLYYVSLNAGTEYTLYNVNTIYYSYSLDAYSTVYTTDYANKFTPSENCYLLQSNTSFYVTYSNVSGDSPGGDSPGGDVSGNGGSVNIDLTSIESKLDNVIVLQRSILMTLLVMFLFPIIKSCANLLKGGKDV